jgi:hypothetical protein
MTFQYTIKKCKISVDRKKYTKNDISISDRYMFIHYSKPKGYSGKVMVNMEKPSEQVSKIEYDGTDHILRFTWTGLWEDEDTGKESKKTLQFKIDFERPVDGSRVYLALIGKPLTIKKGKKTHRAPGIITRKFKSKKYDWKGQKEKIKKRKAKNKNNKTKKKGRKGPEESATKFSVGTKKKGNDGKMWIVKENKNGIQRWIKNLKGGMFGAPAAALGGDIGDAGDEGRLQLEVADEQKKSWDGGSRKRYHEQVNFGNKSIHRIIENDGAKGEWRAQRRVRLPPRKDLWWDIGVPAQPGGELQTSDADSDVAGYWGTAIALINRSTTPDDRERIEPPEELNTIDKFNVMYDKLREEMSAEADTDEEGEVEVE